MEKELLSALKTLLVTILNNDSQPCWIAMWNNQVEKLKQTDEEGNPLYPINLPGIFLEIEAPTDIQQLGNGVQLYDFRFNLHIVDNQADAGDEEGVDQNMAIFDIKKSVFTLLQGQWVDKFGQFVRVSEIQDYEHNNVYHFIQSYTSNYTDWTMNQPVNGISYGPPINLQDSYNFTPGEPS